MCTYVQCNAKLRGTAKCARNRHEVYAKREFTRNVVRAHNATADFTCVRIFRAAYRPYHRSAGLLHTQLASSTQNAIPIRSTEIRTQVKSAVTCTQALRANSYCGSGCIALVRCWYRQLVTRYFTSGTSVDTASWQHDTLPQAHVLTQPCQLATWYMYFTRIALSCSGKVRRSWNKNRF